MLPQFLDVTHMRIITWVILTVCFITMFMVIKHIEKAMLRVVVAGLLLAVVAGCYFYQKDLAVCQNTGKACSFLQSKVPNVNAGVNDLTK